MIMGRLKDYSDEALVSLHKEYDHMLNELAGEAQREKHIEKKYREITKYDLHEAVEDVINIERAMIHRFMWAHESKD